MVVMFGFTSALAEWTGTTVYHSDGVMAIIMTNQWKLKSDFLLNFVLS